MISLQNYLGLQPINQESNWVFHSNAMPFRQILVFLKSQEFQGLVEFFKYGGL